MARTYVEGSSDELRPGDSWAAPLPCEASLSATIYLRPSPEAPDGSVAAAAGDMSAVQNFVTSCGISITRSDAASRRIFITGTAEQMQAAFGVQLRSVKASDGHEFTSYQGSIAIPDTLAGVIVAVLGLSQRTVAHHH